MLDAGVDVGKSRKVSRIRELSTQLEHVYWIGGGSGAGKSTIARRIAVDHGLRRFSTDDVIGDHASRCTPPDCPLLHDFVNMTMDERWVARSPEQMLDTFHWFRGEGFDLIVDDLMGLPFDRGVIVEGFRLLPGLVEPLLTDRTRAVWLLPTPEFRQAAFTSRGSLWQIARETSDPARALRNLLERDRMFTERLRDDVRQLRLAFIEVDTGTTEDELVARVAVGFGLT